MVEFALIGPCWILGRKEENVKGGKGVSFFVFTGKTMYHGYPYGGKTVAGKSSFWVHRNSNKTDILLLEKMGRMNITQTIGISVRPS